jgi:hypothetical protein
MSAISLNGQRFLQETWMPVEMHGGSWQRKKFTAGDSDQVPVLLHAALDRRDANSCKNKKAAPDNSGAALSLFCQDIPEFAIR